MRQDEPRKKHAPCPHKNATLCQAFSPHRECGVFFTMFKHSSALIWSAQLMLKSKLTQKSMLNIWEPFCGLSGACEARDSGIWTVPRRLRSGNGPWYLAPRLGVTRIQRFQKPMVYDRHKQTLQHESTRTPLFFIKSCMLLDVVHKLKSFACIYVWSSLIFCLYLTLLPVGLNYQSHLLQCWHPACGH